MMKENPNISHEQANIIADVAELHRKFGVDKKVAEMSPEMLDKFLRFRLGCIQEELDETFDAQSNGDAEETVDGLIDLIVFAVGTLDILGIRTSEAWRQVHAANMSKEVGIKEGRPNPFGLPDLVKPKGWKAPSHKDNHGDLPKAYCG